MSHDDHVTCDREISILSQEKLELKEKNRKLRKALEEIKTQHLKVWTIANNALNK